MRGTTHKYKEMKWLYKTPYRKKNSTRINTHGAKYLTKSSAYVVAENPVSEQ